MVIIADKNYNLKDYAAQFDQSGQELAIAEVLSKSNTIIEDMPVVESNLDSGHEYAVRTELGAAPTRAYNPSKRPPKWK